MNIYTIFYIQAVLCIITFIPIYFLIKSCDKLKSELQKKLKMEK